MQSVLSKKNGQAARPVTIGEFQCVLRGDSALPGLDASLIVASEAAGFLTRARPAFWRSFENGPHRRYWPFFRADECARCLQMPTEGRDI